MLTSACLRGEDTVWSGCFGLPSTEPLVSTEFMPAGRASMRRLDRQMRCHMLGCRRLPWSLHKEWLQGLHLVRGPGLVQAHTLRGAVSSTVKDACPQIESIRLL